MILKGFKENSNKKYIETQLKTREVIADYSPISSLGVIVNSHEFTNYDWFKDLGEVLHIKEHKVKVIVYTEDDIQKTHFTTNTVFGKEAIGWKGTIKDSDVKMFVDTHFDALISYYKEDETPLKLATVASKATFKIGIFENDDRFNDLIIKTDVNDTTTFQKELIKYLKVLKRI